MPRPRDQKCESFWKGLGRAFAGATLFSLPLMMTMEMWELGFYMAPGRLAVFILVTVFLLVGLERYRGFKRNDSRLNTIVDAFVAYAVGFISSAFFLFWLEALDADAGAREIFGKIALQAAPAGVGAALARSQFGEDCYAREEKKMSDGRRYFYDMFLMLAGAIFLSLNMAPTEEITLVAYKAPAWKIIAVVLFSVAAMHGLVYGAGFSGGKKKGERDTFLRLFLGHTLAGYAIALASSFYLLWSFGKLDGDAFSVALSSVIVLSLPGAVGAASARLII